MQQLIRKKYGKLNQILNHGSGKRKDCRGQRVHRTTETGIHQKSRSQAWRGGSFDRDKGVHADSNKRRRLMPPSKMSLGEFFQYVTNFFVCLLLDIRVKLTLHFASECFATAIDFERTARDDDLGMLPVRPACHPLKRPFH